MGPRNLKGRGSFLNATCRGGELVKPGQKEGRSGSGSKSGEREESGVN